MGTNRKKSNEPPRPRVVTSLRRAPRTPIGGNKADLPNYVGPTVFAAHRGGTREFARNAFYRELTPVETTKVHAKP